MNRHLDRIKRVLIYSLAMVVRTFTPIKSNRIFMWSYSFDKYACNPRAFTEYLLKAHPGEYEIFWGFKKGYKPQDIDSRIHIVNQYSFAYLKAIYTSKYIFSNKRNYKLLTMFNKKHGQKYIMMWHGSFALKKIEKDAEVQLGKAYVKRAQEDSRMCDLMLSNSKMYTSQIKNSFWYNGEILENCVPRNCIFYEKDKIMAAYTEVRKRMGFAPDCKIVLYAPTFRGGSKDLKYYRIDWNNVIPALEKMLGGEVKVLLRLHPNMSNFKDLSYITNFKNVHNVTQAPDITEFMFAADAMISDYTSAMFDFIILDKPCFIYAIDQKEYDRGFYWSLDSLPFPIAKNSQELITNIEEFTPTAYKEKTDDFKKNIWGLEEDGKAGDRLYEWMKRN